MYPRWIRGVRPCARIPLVTTPRPSLRRTEFRDLSPRGDLPMPSPIATPSSSRCRRQEVQPAGGPAYKVVETKAQNASNADVGKEPDPETFTVIMTVTHYSLMVGGRLFDSDHRNPARCWLRFPLLLPVPTATSTLLFPCLLHPGKFRIMSHLLFFGFNYFS